MLTMLYFVQCCCSSDVYGNIWEFSVCETIPVTLYNTCQLHPIGFATELHYKGIKMKPKPKP